MFSCYSRRCGGNDRLPRVTLSILDSCTGAWIATRTLTRSDTGARVIAVNERTGRAFIPVLGAVRGPNVVAPTSVYVLSTTTGAVMNIVALHSVDQALVVDPMDNRVFVLGSVSATIAGAPLGQSSMSMLDGKSSRLLRTTTIAGGPAALAFDARDGLAAVSSGQAAYGPSASSPVTGTISIVDDARGVVTRTFTVVQPTPYMAAVNGTSIIYDESVSDSGLFDARTGRVVGLSGAKFGSVMTTAPVAVDNRRGLLVLVGHAAFRWN